MVTYINGKIQLYTVVYPYNNIIDTYEILMLSIIPVKSTIIKKAF